MTTNQIIASVIAAWPVLGAAGTAIEAIGKATKRPKLVAVGTRLEAIFLDGEKLIKGTPAS